MRDRIGKKGERSIMKGVERRRESEKDKDLGETAEEREKSPRGEGRVRWRP